MTTPAPKSTPAGAQTAQSEQEKIGNTQTKAADLPSAGQTVKVRFKRVPPALAYSMGEVADLPQALYDQHVGDGEYFDTL